MLYIILATIPTCGFRSCYSSGESGNTRTHTVTHSLVNQPVFPYIFPRISSAHFPRAHARVRKNRLVTRLSDRYQVGPDSDSTLAS